MLKCSSDLKEFGPKGFKVKETVARTPSLDRHGISYGWKPDIFCLRIDIDEYSPGSFNPYYSVFERYREAITIFFNINSFKDAKDQILRCRGLGIDIQSHTFYHYTYRDYASNRYNISKAKTFFQEIGINTTEFAAPLGWWNASFMKALEDERYKYSSDFSYDYMGFSSFPFEQGKYSTVMQIPIFPVAPELFFQRGTRDNNAILGFYKKAINEMESCALPVFVYAHTSKFREIPGMLNDIVGYAVLKKGQSPINMAEFSGCWRKRYSYRKDMNIEKSHLKVSGDCFLGRETSIGII